MSKTFASARVDQGVRRSRARSPLALTTAAADLLVIVAVTLIAAVGRNTLPMFETVGDIPENVSAAGLFIVVGWLAALVISGAYDDSHFAAGAEEYRRVFTASLAAAGLVGIGCYLARFPLSRGFYVLLFALGIPLLLLSRCAGRRVIQRLRSRGRLSRRILIAGAPRHVEALADVLQRESWLGYSIIGCVTANDHPYPETRTGIPILGRTADVADVLAGRQVDTLLIAEGAFAPGSSLRQTAWALEGQRDLQIAVAPSLTDVAAGRVEMRPVAGLPLVYIGHGRAQDAAHWAKRVFDIVGSLALLVLTVAAVALVGAADQAARRRTGALPADPRGSRRPELRVPQAAHHGAGGRADPARPSGPTGRTCSSRCAWTRGSPARAAGCGATRSTSCPSWSTSCGAR